MKLLKLIFAVALSCAVTLAYAAPKTKAPPRLAPTPATSDAPVVTGPILRPISQVVNDYLALAQTRGVAEVYNQKLAYMLPKGLVPGRDFDSGNVYAIELTPPGGPLTAWSYRLSITGYRNIGNLSGGNLAEFAKQYEQPGDSCPDNYVAKPLGPLKVDGNDALMLLTGCTRARLGEYVGAIEGAGEVSVVTIIQGLYDIYVVQVTFRGQQYGKDIWPISDATARQIVDRLNPMALCAASVTTQQCVSRQNEVSAGAP